jgi:hypothetical protein
LKTLETILEVAGEGGSIKLEGERDQDRWQFRLVVGEMDLLDDDEPTPSKVRHGEWKTSCPSALQRLDRYPWAYLYPLNAHPAFITEIESPVKARLKGANERYLERWSDFLSEPPSSP